MAGHTRLAIANHAVPDLRPHAVAADQRTSFDGFAVIKRQRNVVAMILEGIDTAACFKGDQVAALAGFQERAVNIRAVSDTIRLAKPFQKFLAERNVGDQLARQGVAHFLRGRAMSISKDGILQADFFEYAKNIWPKLDTGTDFAKFGRLLENPNGKALVCQRIGPGEGVA